MRRLFIASCLLALSGGPALAQVAVHDQAVTARNAITAAIQEMLFETERDQHGQFRRMARRLSVFTSLNKYRLQDTPKWRIHDFENYLYANGYHAALNYGDPAGAAFLAVSHPVVAGHDVWKRRPQAVRETLMPRLATLDVADATAMTAIHTTGTLRYDGRRELQAIETLEDDVVDPSDELSATAVLDKISVASLIAARQRQTRVQLLAGVVEQLLVDTKRSRDADATAMNMQLTTWRDATRVNRAFAAGAGDALRSWRQP